MDSNILFCLRFPFHALLITLQVFLLVTSTLCFSYTSAGCSKYCRSIIVPSVLVLVIATSGGDIGGVLATLPLHLIAIFPQDHVPALSRALRKAVSDVDSGMIENNITLMATPFEAFNNSYNMVTSLCDTFKTHNPSAILSFVDKHQAFFPSLVSSYVRIPVLGLSRAYTDEASLDINQFYLSLDPSSIDLAESIFRFLRTNEWLHASIIRDDSKFSTTFTRHLLSKTKAALWSDSVRELQVLGHYNKSQIFQVISSIRKNYVRVILLICDKDVSLKVFQEARSANLLTGDWIWIVIEKAFSAEHRHLNKFPAGTLGIKLRVHSLDRHDVRNAVNLFAESIKRLDIHKWSEAFQNFSTGMSCWFSPNEQRKKFTQAIFRSTDELIQALRKFPPDPRPSPEKEMLQPTVFDIYSLIPDTTGLYSSRRKKSHWKHIGNITSSSVSMQAVMWLKGNQVGPSSMGRPRFRIVTAFAPPFVKLSTRVENGSCLLGVPCLQVLTNSKDNLSRIFIDYAAGRSEGETYNITCCAGIAMDLLIAVARDLMFDYDLYLVADGLFGTNRGPKWNGITADLMTGAAHMAFSAFSMTSMRSRVIDFSAPFFHSGVSCLTYTQERDVPLSAFLIPFSVQLWVAIFVSLNATAVCAAIYEWLSPFGLNPWGRMRSKNFSLASALWVMWSLLFSHLVAFKAPKSWPNKVLINLWGCFSVIFVSSYTANIAAHFAGLFFHLKVDDFRDASLLNQRTGTAKASAAEGYVFAENPELWQHIQNHGVANLEDGLEKLRKGELDVLIGDTVILDYFRGNEPGCGLHLLGPPIFDDAYAVGMQKRFPLKDAISTLVLRYNAHGFMEQLQKKWYGRVPCFDLSVHRLNKPKPLSVGAVAGVFVMLVVGLLVGIVILVMEHMVFKHALPVLRKKPPECFWKSPNLMFFSQKLYRFINTVELVSPHHSAKEIVTNLREGQIFSLFQKSVKRRAKEEARRRKSKSQFFEMIQEVRNVVRLQKQQRRGSTLQNPEPGSQRLLSPEAFTYPEDRQLLLSGQRENFGTRRDANHDWNYRILHSPNPNVSSTSNAPTQPGFRFRRGWNNRISERYRAPYAMFGSEGFGPSLYSYLQQDYVSGLNELHLSDDHSSLSSCDSTKSSEECQHVRGENIVPVRSFSVEDLRLLSSSRERNRQDAFLKFQNLRKFHSVDDLSILKQKKTLTVETQQRKRAKKRGIFCMEKEDGRFRPLKNRYDELLIYAMTKEQILHSWQSSERKLLNRLKETLQAKKALEEKLAFIQKTLVKPP